MGERKKWSDRDEMDEDEEWEDDEKLKSPTPTLLQERILELKKEGS